MPCCGPFSQDFQLSFFGVKDFEDKTIDVQASFNRKPFWVSFLAKFLLVGWTFQVLGLDLLQYTYPEFYLAYLTHWALVMAIFYFVLSFVLTVFGIPKQPTGVEPLRPAFMVRLVWGLFSTAACLQWVVTLLFWLVKYSPDHNVSYESYMKHGGFAILILLEGLILNKVPIRLKHFVFVCSIAALYLIWTLIHSYLNIGNPTQQDEDPETDDDSIYQSLNWKSRPTATAILSVISLFVVPPTLFVIIWGLSLCGRRYVVQTNNKKSSRTSGKVGSDYALTSV